MKKPIVINPETDVLLNIDIQETFMPGGGLPVPDGDAIVPVARRVTDLFPKENRIATLDWHPEGHISLAESFVGVAPNTKVTFEEVAKFGAVRIAPKALFTFLEFYEYMSEVKHQVLWATHGNPFAHEAQLHPAFARDEFWFVLVKGMDPKCDSYSAFYDNLRRPTGLTQILDRRYTRRVFMQGLALDYCIGYSALSAARDGFEVYIIENATRSVGYPPGNDSAMKNVLRVTPDIQLIQETDLVR